MGMAASQARFLCLTARKADCEFKSTDLAQQKLNITSQLADISNDYAHAMNATKLMWSNENAAADFGLSYGVLMSPSALNDYNAYMVTTQSGAIVLNSQYARAAKAAGISRAGGVGSQEQRDKFISALAGEGIVTSKTAQEITKHDYTYENGAIKTDSVSESLGSTWDPYAGMGGAIQDKSSGGMFQLVDLILSESVGMKEIEWGTLLLEGSKSNGITQQAYDDTIDEYDSMLDNINDKKITDEIITELRHLKAAEEKKDQPNTTTITGLEKLILQCQLLKDPKKVLSDADKTTLGIGDMTPEAYNSTNMESIFNSLRAKIQTAKTNFTNDNSSNLLNTSGVNYINTENTLDKNGYTIIQNGVIVTDASTVEELTLGDILTSNIVLFSNCGNAGWSGSSYNFDNGQPENATKLVERVTRLFDSIVENLGYSSEGDVTGHALNVDSDAAAALEFAYNMTVRRFGQIDNSGNQRGNSVVSNSAYDSAVNMNAIGMDNESMYGAVSLTNMVASFLTYYDNYLRGVNSEYVVGKSTEQSVYVTDNPEYYFASKVEEAEDLSIADKTADFFDQLYNNILAHGWREDISVDDPEYLESLIKDGRYSMSSLNPDDGYYYQSRYNETGYIVEVSDTDAIARAEAEFTAKKAELTYKENSIDLKTKELDTEISSITQELESVKNLITKGIEKTFSMFQQ